LHRLAISNEDSVGKGDCITGKADNPLEQHNPAAGKTDGHHIAVCWLRKKIALPPVEMKAAIVKGRLHALAIQVKGRQDKSKHDPGGKGNRNDAAQ